MREGSKYYLWRLTRKASLPGIDISRDYEIPVYPTRQGSARIAGRPVDASQHATPKVQRYKAHAAMERIRDAPAIQGPGVEL